MGGSSSKSSAQGARAQAEPSSSSSVAAEPRVEAHADPFKKYTAFRNELFTFSLGESAFDYAEVLFKGQPDSPEVMALLAETAALYDEHKNKVGRGHWVDRLDLLQRGVDVSRKCIKENPDYGPCYRTYVMCATREAEALYWVSQLGGVGLLENYHAIMKRGERAMELLPQDAEVPNLLGGLNARCACRWYSPLRSVAWYHGVPAPSELLQRSIELHQKAVENHPTCLEYTCRLAQAYFQAGDYPNARRWFNKVRDEMPPEDLKDAKWQSLAHTQLSTSFAKTKWNVPFA